MSIKLIATDLDGTLFNEKSELSEGNIQAIREAVDAGIPVVPCSGRCPVDLSYVLSRLGQNMPMVAFNGAHVVLNQQVIYQQPMSRELMEAIMAVCTRYGAFTNVCTAETRYNYPLSTQRERCLQQQASLGSHGVRVIPLEGWEEIPVADRSRVLKILTSLQEPEAMAAMRAEIDALPIPKTSSASWWNNVEVMAPGVDKGRSLLKLCEALHVDASELMVLGDAENDLSMFRVAGWPVAMGNAMDCVKELAKAVTLTNREDGVAAAIRRYALLQG